MTNNYFSQELFLGLVNKINTYNCFVKIPKPCLLNSFYFDKQQYCGGIVGKYVIVKSENLGFLGVIQEVSLPKNTDYTIEDIEIKDNDIYKTDLRIKLLLSFEYEKITENNVEPISGIKEFPLIGSKIYICHTELLKRILSRISKDGNVSLPIGKVISNDLPFNISIVDLFVRHCAIVGTTGGGKSYTIGKIIEEINDYNKGNKDNNKKLNVALFDATGEFEALGKDESNIKRYKFGELSDKDKKHNIESVYFSYKNFSTSDWFALFNPSANVQAIKLREAIKSLKVIYSQKEEKTNGVTCGCYEKADKPIADCYKKAGTPIAEFSKKLEDYSDNVYDDETSNFEITNLAEQISHECIWPICRINTCNFGGRDERDEGYCLSLISKINYKVKNKAYSKIFNFNNNLDNSKNIAEILNVDDDNLIKIISLKDVSFDDNMRAVLMNCIGRFLLDKARNGDYEEKPRILIIDEAHQFLNTKVSGNYAPDIHLNAFDNIAKECRKHGLYMCLSTQMPRDIPSGILSQVGTFIVHRLINKDDKDKVKDTCQESTIEIMSYLPILGEGECILISNHIPMPLHIKVAQPSDNFKPSSESPLNEFLKNNTQNDNSK
ncbi:MAG: ATP-binding protein [Alphaproteobacteria bacterium]|nr:ATP-binding protein [Rickettsiales bacterium]